MHYRKYLATLTILPIRYLCRHLRYYHFANSILLLPVSPGFLLQELMDIVVLHQGYHILLSHLQDFLQKLNGTLDHLASLDQLRP